MGKIKNIAEYVHLLLSPYTLQGISRAITQNKLQFRRDHDSKCPFNLNRPVLLGNVLVKLISCWSTIIQ